MAAVLRAAIARGRSDTGVFGLRLQRPSFGFLMGQLARIYPSAQTDADRIEAAFGSTAFIYLKREDKVAQAVSFVKAQQSGLWHRAPDGTEIERLSPPRTPAYDALALRAAYDMFLSYDLEWEDWFATSKLRPLRLSYEALAEDPQEVLAKVLIALGLTVPGIKNMTPGVAKLADDESRRWAARFKQELKKAGTTA